jgi:hypothetical protein
VNDVVSPEVREMQGAAALPRDNGELTFAAPWQGRVLALAIGTVQYLGVDWDEFRTRLIDAIATDPHRPYYESWTVALEALVDDFGLAAAHDARFRSDQEGYLT